MHAGAGALIQLQTQLNSLLKPNFKCSATLMLLETLICYTMSEWVDSLKEDLSILGMPMFLIMVRENVWSLVLKL